MESWKGNAKRGCGGWMEECGKGAAVEQLTARGMVSIPTMGAIAWWSSVIALARRINPRNGGQ